MNNRKRVIYIGILFIITVIVSITTFSYAFLTRVDEQHGKLNMVVGDLNYKIESNDLTNNSITLSAGEATEIELTIKAENEIDTKFELYTNSVENVSIGYLDEEGFEEPTGTISKNGTKKIKIVLDNTSETDKTITFGVQGGFEHNTITLASNRSSIPEGEGLCRSGIAYEFDYTGNVQEFTAKCAGVYKLEVWGAQGQSYYTTSDAGYGGYAVGVTTLEKNSVLQVVTGGTGTTSVGGYNGGGLGTAASGGGATHIALKNSSNTYTTLSSYGNATTAANYVYIVAGGGGGLANQPYATPSIGSAGGGISGTSGSYDRWTSRGGGPGNQSSGGSYGLCNDGGRCGNNGSFGTGGSYYTCNSTHCATGAQAGGGAGWYGGGSSRHSGAGGGSGWIGNSNLINKKMVCYNCSTSTATNTYTESNTCREEIPTENCSKKGNGHARITYLEKPTELNSKVLTNNSVITANSTNLHLNNTSTYYNENGLYKYTYDNKTTYFFRGNVTNNYVRFAENTWRIVRINEDGTIRLIMQDGINNNQIVAYNNSKSSIYYTESDAKALLENWYNTNLSAYSDYIETGNYYCEQFKVAYSTAYATNVGMPETTTYTNYVPNFICGSDKNGKGIVTSNIGLITYDELAFAGAYYGIANNAFYLYNGSITWSMSSDGGTTSEKQVWGLDTAGNIGMSGVSSIIRALRPVINLNSNVKVSGSGTLIDPYVVY